MVNFRGTARRNYVIKTVTVPDCAEHKIKDGV